MFVSVVFAALTLLSLGLLFWQFVAAARFPLHRRIGDEPFGPAITILKPIKGFDGHTAACLRSWLVQNYRGEVQVLFGVAEQTDPVCEIVRELLKHFPNLDAELVITPEPLGSNAKIATVTQLNRRAKYDIICLSDADVSVTKDFLANAVAPLRASGVGLVNCFYQLANPTTLAMRWEAIAINADFWSQVLQSNTIKRQDFALGAAMFTRREMIAKIGGFESLLDYLADDYQLGRRIAATGARIELSPVVVECWTKAMNLHDVWHHQLRWARTIRVSQPVPYFFSVLGNVTLWSCLWSGSVLAQLNPALPPFANQEVIWIALMALLGSWFCRVATACYLQRRFTQNRDAFRFWWLVPAKDLLQVGIWAASFLGNTVEWRGKRFRLARGGKLTPL